MLLLSSADFSKFQLFHKFLSGILVPFVGPDLGPNCLQRLSAYDKKVAAGKERVDRSIKMSLINGESSLLIWMHI